MLTQNEAKQAVQYAAALPEYVAALETEYAAALAQQRVVCAQREAWAAFHVNDVHEAFIRTRLHAALKPEGDHDKQ